MMNKNKTFKDGSVAEKIVIGLYVPYYFAKKAFNELFDGSWIEVGKVTATMIAAYFIAVTILI